MEFFKLTVWRPMRCSRGLTYMPSEVAGAQTLAADLIFTNPTLVVPSFIMKLAPFYNPCLCQHH